jgi:hypothetical protein
VPDKRRKPIGAGNASNKRNPLGGGSRASIKGGTSASVKPMAPKLGKGAAR